MKIETRAVVKRIAALVCSITVIACVGYAVGGAGGYLAGRGNPWAIVRGLSGGAVFTYMSLLVWRSYLDDAITLNERDEAAGKPPPSA